MRYLMDSLQSYESGHGDALNPHRLEADKSFMGDSDALKPPTVAEFRTFSEKILTKLDNLAAAHPQSTALPDPQVAASVVAALNLMSLAGQTRQAGDTQVAASATSNATSLILPVPAMAAHSPSEDLAPMEIDMPERPIPIAGVSIPSVGRDAKAWRRAVDQWEFGNPAVGLTPLKDWPTHYYTGTMHCITGSLYSNRKLVAEEYRRWAQSFHDPNRDLIFLQIG